MKCQEIKHQDTNDNIEMFDVTKMSPVNDETFCRCTDALVQKYILDLHAKCGGVS